MTDIVITDLTNKTCEEVGTGVFDLLQESVNLHIGDQYDNGRITGAEYATVYLGALQSVLQQSLTYLLEEQEASKKIDLLDKQIEEIIEKIDLVVAQTAQAYEAIAASQAKTNRENILNSKQVLLTESQTTDQEYITDNIRPAELAKILAETSLVEAREAEVLASTVRGDAESAQKILLMQAQTLGFVSDTKQKILKQMNDTFAVGFSVANDGSVPASGKAYNIDILTQEIIDDVDAGTTLDITPVPLP